MDIYKFPRRDTWASIIKRPQANNAQLREVVESILDDIKLHGDEAVKRYCAKFDKVLLTALEVTAEEWNEADAFVSDDLKEAILLAHHNIEKFHQSQVFRPVKVETSLGVECWQQSVPIEKVGLYIPGGTAPLFSTVLMLATPARIAGCSEIVLCTPPNKDGKVHPAILYAAKVAGVSQIFKAGGVQAIGAMAYGTETIPKVYKIFGPGNQYVMTAKQFVSLQDVAIDMPAGPSEVCVIADETSCAEFVAADLLSQAEHGVDSQVLLITTSEQMLLSIQSEIDKQLEQLPRKELAKASLKNSRCVLVRSLSEAMDLSNAYAPEHLILSIESYNDWVDKVVNAGSVFLGKYACESAGDYASGTNHTLPTHGFALSYSGVNLDSYNRKITFQHLTPAGVHSIGKAVEVMAAHEELDAHKNAMSVRVKSLNNKSL